MTRTLQRKEGQVQIDPPTGARRLVRVRLHDPKIFSPRTEIETAYPAELIELILDVKGAAWLCDEIARDEDPAYVGKYLETELEAYFHPEDFAGGRILDFGCGSGASTVWLARLFPESEIVGVELESDLLSIARARLAFYDFPNVTFLRSPSGLELPEELGRFDLITMSAVYEHLLPAERKVIMPQLWSLLREGGCLFVNQTPNRIFPIELHTTGLPLINYLPDALTWRAARRFSARVSAQESWETLLRKGIRGATVREIKSRLADNKAAAVLLEPRKSGMRDRVDLWFSNTNPANLYALKRLMKSALKAVLYLTGIAMVPDIAVAFQKKVLKDE